MLTHLIRWLEPHRAWISRRRLLLWLARRILISQREGSVTSIRLGEARGLRWRRSRRHIVTEYWLGTFEPLVQRTVAEGLAPGDAFFDAGANVGFISLVGARAVGPTGLVVAIEPNADDVAELEAQAALNGFDHVVAVRKAVTADVAGAWSWVNGDVVIPTTIDHLTLEFRPPALIKIDVEGLELEALRGARETLREHRPTVVAEAHSPELAAATSARLVAAGYRCETFRPPHGSGFHIVAQPA